MATETLLLADNATHRATTTASTTAAAATTTTAASLLSGTTVAPDNTVAIASIVGINASFTVVCLCFVLTCLSFVAHRFLGRREQRDKICDIITSRYWSNEDEIIRVIQIMKKMQDAVIFRDVTAYHVLAYKYRTNNDVYGEGAAGAAASRPADTGLLCLTAEAGGGGGADVFAAMKKIEHLFDALLLQLPFIRRCPGRVADTFGSTVSGLALRTALMWDEHKAALVRRLVVYFAGNDAAAAFDQALVGDRELDTTVLSKIPYVGQLSLCVDHFVLKDVVIVNEARLELRAKIRYVDTILSRNGRVLALKDQAMIESYYAARDICLRNGFVQSRAHFPDVLAREGEQQRKLDECIVCLRHLVRLMCYGTNMKKMETDDDFYQFVMRLHEVLYSWIDAQAMLEVIERSRARIIAYLQGITADQILANREFTKAKLEEIEKQLCPIEAPQQQQPEQEQEEEEEEEETPYPPLVMPGTSGVERLVSVSIEEPPPPPPSSAILKFAAVSPERIPLAEKGAAILAQRGILEQHGSAVVSGSSLYVTAGSLSSTSETALSEPKAAAASTPHPGELAPEASSEGDGEYFETPV